VHAFGMVCAVGALRVALNALRGAPLMDDTMWLTAITIGLMMLLCRWVENVPLVGRPRARIRGYYQTS
jgi:hypothetical protein